MKNRAFTLIELLVVMGVMAILAVMFLRALASTTESSLRTQCLNNLRQLGIGMTLCANDNNGFLVSAKPSDNDNSTPGNPPFVQFAISPHYTNELKAAGIPLQTNAPSVWCCPDIQGLPYPDPAEYQWIVGYQYFGGITEWTPDDQTGIFNEPHSPIKLTQSKPYWCLAADLVVKINGKWGGIDTLAPLPVQDSMETWPPHREGTNAVPTGGNEVFADGSASWCRVETMHQFTTWNIDYIFWFYQNTDDLTASEKSLMNTLSWSGR
jgi:prepilin-type N-terminal cleavage/methylation domain-containing protein